MAALGGHPSSLQTPATPLAQRDGSGGHAGNAEKEVMSFPLGPTASFSVCSHSLGSQRTLLGTGVGAVFLLIRFLQDSVQCSALRLDNPRCKIYS